MLERNKSDEEISDKLNIDIATIQKYRKDFLMSLKQYEVFISHVTSFLYNRIIK